MSKLKAKVSHHWHESSKECNEAVHFQNDSKDRPAQQEDENPTQEAGCTFQPFYLTKEAPSSFKTNAEHKTSNAEEVSNGKEAFVEEHENSKEEKEHSKPSKTNAQFLLVTDLHICNCNMLKIHFNVNISIHLRVSYIIGW